jgi:hypothetical protein
VGAVKRRKRTFVACAVLPVYAEATGSPEPPLPPQAERSSMSAAAMDTKTRIFNFIDIAAFRLIRSYFVP